MKFFIILLLVLKVTSSEAYVFLAEEGPYEAQKVTCSSEKNDKSLEKFFVIIDFNAGTFVEKVVKPQHNYPVLETYISQRIESFSKDSLLSFAIGIGREVNSSKYGASTANSLTISRTGELILLPETEIRLEGGKYINCQGINIAKNTTTQPLRFPRSNTRIKVKIVAPNGQEKKVYLQDYNKEGLGRLFGQQTVLFLLEREGEKKHDIIEFELGLYFERSRFSQDWRYLPAVLVRHKIHRKIENGHFTNETDNHGGQTLMAIEGEFDHVLYYKIQEDGYTIVTDSKLSFKVEIENIHHPKALGGFKFEFKNYYKPIVE